MLIGLVLAAGKGSRMGQNKMLVKLHHKPLLHHALDHAEASHLDKLIVVTGFEEAKIRTSIHHRNAHLPLYAVGAGLTLVHNPAFASGLASSLKAGLQAALTQFPEVKGVMVLLGDMPFVTPQMLNQLLAQFEKETDVIVPIYAGEKGNPVLWGKAHFNALFALEGDKGARELLKTLPHKTVELSQGITLDIDTPEILQQFQ